MITILLAASLLVALVVIASLHIKNTELYHRVEAYKSLHDTAVNELHGIKVRTDGIVKRLGRPPTLSAPPDKRTLGDIAAAEAGKPNGELWYFAYVNSDLMPEWELYSEGMAESPIHIRNSAWATFCANLTVMHRDCLEESIEELAEGAVK